MIANNQPAQNTEHDAFQAWFDQRRLEKWLRSNPSANAADMPANWDSFSRPEMETAWMARAAMQEQPAMPADAWLNEHERLVLTYKDAVFNTTGSFLDKRRTAFDSVMAHARRRITGD